MSVDIRADLRARFGMARDQGRRPTCVAFAGSDCHSAMRSETYAALSVEYAFCHAVKRKGGAFDSDAGVPLCHLLSAIEHDGQPMESAWPYLKNTPPSLAEYQPPPIAAGLYKRASKYDRIEVGAICRALDGGLPSIVVFSPTLDFHLAQMGIVVRSSGNRKPSAELHAVVAVGWGMDGPERVVLVRNSWGQGWAESGCAWMSEHYLQPLLRAVVTMER